MTPRNILFSKEDIVEAAFQLVRKQGWQGFSVQAVARAIGGSSMPIYSHFANLRELEDEVVWKALEALKARMRPVITGDRWIDDAINWVRFAEEEKHLHRILFDGRNVEQCVKCGQEINRFISEGLADYPLFQGLSDVELKMITLSRRLFIQKLALWLNKDPDYLAKQGLDTVTFIRMTSMALYDGFKMQFQKEKS